MVLQSETNYYDQHGEKSSWASRHNDTAAIGELYEYFNKSPDIKSPEQCGSLVQEELVHTSSQTNPRIDDVSSPNALQLTENGSEKKKEILQQLKQVTTLACPIGVQVAHNVLTQGKTMTLRLILSEISQTELELRDCSLTGDCLKEICCAEQVQISKLTISSTSNIGDILNEIRECVIKFRVTHLCIEENEIHASELTLISKRLLPQDSKLCGLDLSYNKNMGDFCTLGKIVRTHSIKELQLVNCDLTDKDIESLHQGLGDWSLSVLDVSHNLDLTEKGFKLLPQLLNTKIDYLSLCGCYMTDIEVGAFRDAIAVETMIKHLDLSYNDELDTCGIAIVGDLVSRCSVEMLSLAGCNLDKETLESLKGALQQCKIKLLDFSDNMTIGSGVKIVADLVGQCSVQHLDMSDCKFNSQQVESFAKQLIGFKLRTLNLSDSERIIDEKYTKSLCELIPHVDEELNICFTKMMGKSRDILQSSLDSHKRLSKGPKIKLAHGTTRDINIEDIKIMPTTSKDDVITRRSHYASDTDLY